MSTLTKEEKAWIKKVSSLLLNPPTDRLGLYTIGDCCISVYDKNKQMSIYRQQDVNDCDFCTAVDRCNARLGDIESATEIHSTAG